METTTSTKRTAGSLRVTQRAMERRLLGVSLRVKEIKEKKHRHRKENRCYGCGGKDGLDKVNLVGHIGREVIKGARKYHKKDGGGDIRKIAGYKEHKT